MQQQISNQPSVGNQHIGSTLTDYFASPKKSTNDLNAICKDVLHENGITLQPMQGIVLNGFAIVNDGERFSAGRVTDVNATAKNTKWDAAEMNQPYRNKGT